MHIAQARLKITRKADSPNPALARMSPSTKGAYGDKIPVPTIGLVPPKQALIFAVVFEGLNAHVRVWFASPLWRLRQYEMTSLNLLIQRARSFRNKILLVCQDLCKLIVCQMFVVLSKSSFAHRRSSLLALICCSRTPALSYPSSGVNSSCSPWPSASVVAFMPRRSSTR